MSESANYPTAAACDSKPADMSAGAATAIPSEAQECLTILGGCFSRDPHKAENRAFFDGLKAYAEQGAWPFGNPAACAEAFGQIKEGLTDPDYLAEAAGADSANATEDKKEPAPSRLSKEFQRMFVGPEHFAAPAWGSVYLDKEGVLYGPSLFSLRAWLKDNGILVNLNAKEPEDHVGTMLLLAGWIAQNRPELFCEFMGVRLMPWLPTYLDLFEKDARDPFYVGLARLARETTQALVRDMGIRIDQRRIYFQG
jgi:TorA maturation chaperone TorD